MKHSLIMIPLALALLGATQQSSVLFEGRLRLSTTEAVLDESRWFKFDPAQAQCYTSRGTESIQTTCETLIGIGYADRARLTVVEDRVVRLDVLELQQ